MAKYFPTNLVQLKNTTKLQKIGLALFVVVLVFLMYTLFKPKSNFGAVSGTCTDTNGNITISNSQIDCCVDKNNQWNSVSCNVLNSNDNPPPVSLNPPLGGGQFPVIYS
jgi:hypothetical protein